MFQKRFRIEGYIGYRLIMASAAEAEALASAERAVETMEATQPSEEGQDEENKDEENKADSPKDVNGSDEGEGEEKKQRRRKRKRLTRQTKQRRRFPR